MSYAIFKTGGKQYRVSQGDVIDVEKLDHSEGDLVVFSDVLMLAEGASIKVGQELQNVTVEAEVDRQYKGEKVLAYKYRRRKGYHRTVGHRRRLTRLKITGIKG
jgi:large subunit ribosomal protein L21